MSAPGTDRQQARVGQAGRQTDRQIDSHVAVSHTQAEAGRQPDPEHNRPLAERRPQVWQRQRLPSSPQPRAQGEEQEEDVVSSSLPAQPTEQLSSSPGSEKEVGGGSAPRQGSLLAKGHLLERHLEPSGDICLLWMTDIICSLTVMTEEAGRTAMSHHFSQMWKQRLRRVQKWYNRTQDAPVVLGVQLSVQGLA